MAYNIFEIRSYDYKSFPNQIKTECIMCGTEFNIPNKKPYISRPQTCCAYCTNRRIGLLKINGFYKQCIVCDKIMWVSKVHSERKTCGKECQNLSYSIFAEYKQSEKKFGSKKYYGSNWESQRRRARSRDSFKCRKCGISEKEYGIQLSVHHIKPFVYFDSYKEANKLENLISVCEPCHRIIHSGENHPSKFLSEEIKEVHESGRIRKSQRDDAKEIVNLIVTTRKPLKEIAKDVGVSYTTVRRIYQGKRWQELYDAPPKSFRNQ